MSTKQPLDYIDMTQGIREQIVQGLTEGGMPRDNETTSLLLGALNDMDRTAIGVMRVNVASKTNDLNEQALAIADRLSQNIGNPFVGRTVSDGSNIPQPGERVIDFTPVPGHTQIGTETQNYDEFMASRK